MRVLLTGGTGFIGAAVLRRLREAGHEVLAVVRSQRSEHAVTEAGATGLLGDLRDEDWLVASLRGVDAAVHAAAAGDGTDPAMNTAVVDAAIEAFAGTDKPFILTGGIWTYGDNTAIVEDSPDDPPALTRWRVPLEHRLLDDAARGIAIRPGIVYGHGQGIPALLANGPRDDSGALLVPGGEQHWTTVHVDDLAELYLLALQHGTAGAIYLGTDDGSPTVSELGTALGKRVAHETADASRARLGADFAGALLLDQIADSTRTREALGWSPVHPPLIEDPTFTSAG
ncbi:hypothetical protein BHE97_00950 [Aeromicrobium sp. PE09-221]|uniref:NAD-dependent epimerase/dehydratase family protein n=1 Tax=Aeromicrobium sp. PE09-221 TaxID=1898043 RepID=UPI000B3EBE64|nr:NAD-dependent epimerase/dehydratase family protein [Aeromicrobium sp. PE09-221]OUZ12808.1 hypothetical protein BHE97_00950 [Aeromicrobium sp. PE09-221]